MPKATFISGWKLYDDGTLAIRRTIRCARVNDDNADYSDDDSKVRIYRPSDRRLRQWSKIVSAMWFAAAEKYRSGQAVVGEVEGGGVSDC